MGRKRVGQYFIPKQTDQESRVVEMLRILELDSMASIFTKIAETSLKTKRTFFDFLESLAEKEILSREEKRVNRWIQQSKVPFKKTLQEFDFSFQPSIDEVQIRELSSCRYISQGRNIIFLGPSGVGKTHLSSALAIEAIYNGFEARFLRLDNLVEMIEGADSVDLSARLLRNLMRPKLLILDDIDFYKIGENASSFLFKLVTERYSAQLSSIFTSNKPFSEWEELFGNQRRASAALDRILERAEIINIIGESYRVRDQLKKSKLAPPASKK